MNTKDAKEWGVEETTEYDEKLKLLQTRDVRVCTFQSSFKGKAKKGKPKWGVNKTNKNEKILPDKSFYGQLILYNLRQDRYVCLETVTDVWCF